MAKQLNVDLNFRANTSQAKQALMELQTTLSKIAMSDSAPGIDASKMKAASAAAKELSIHLNNAFNAETGKFDLSKLDKSLKTSSTNVTELSTKLLSAGTQGQQAFVQLAQTIAAADRPVVTLNSKLSEMFTTLKNTARWQISSSILHGFMGAVQQAYGYAQDLNKSLTDIRIVTGQNIEQMERFAIEANKAAKALSTTTTEYANASLIYYQQGLNDAQVAERTAITIKMANAAGVSAQTVSDQLTAVWNNFYDGSQSLEYYADVMTALGAATASSTDEISEGLNKFAAVAETVGLSYEYATSALATVTATTRESADVVGTAFKTLFARIQGLTLGETLEDGTDLNKYSEALDKVGIKIKDTNGEMKDMDTILNELGAKWQTLSKDQQTALAQTVAGVRQYTQLVALMDNWDYFQQNLGVAQGSTGALQEQADIYAESWEAARDRVKASLETIYNQMLDDEFFIDISNGFASLLDSLSAFIDGVGGIKTILATVFSFFLSAVSTKIEPALHQLKQNFEIIFTGSSKSAKKMSKEMEDAVSDVLNDPQHNLSENDKYDLNAANQMSKAKNKMFDVESDLSPLEKQRYEMELNILEIEQKNVKALLEQKNKKKEVVDLAEKEVKLAKEKLVEATSNFDEGKAVDIAGSDREDEEAALKRAFEKAKTNYQANGSSENLAALNAAKKAMFEHSEATDNARTSFEHFISAAKQAYETEMELTNGNISASESVLEVGSLFEDYASDLAGVSSSLSSGDLGLKEAKAQLNDLESQLKMATGGALDFSEEFANMQTAANKTQLTNQIDQLVEKLKASNIPAKDLEKILNSLGQGKYTKGLVKGYQNVQRKTEEAKEATEDYQQSIEDLKKAQEELNKKFDKFNPEHKAKAMESFAKSGAGLGKLAASITTIRSAFIALNNEDLSFGEKLTTVTMSLMATVPTLSGGLKDLRDGLTGLNSVFGMTTAVQKMAALAMIQEASSAQILTGELTAQQIAKRTGLTLDQATVLLNQTKGKLLMEEAIAQGSLNSAIVQNTIAETMGISVDQAAAIMSKMKAGASFEEAAAEEGVTIAKSKGIVASIASVVAKKAEEISTKLKIVADKGETAGIWAKVAAYIAEQAAAWPVLVVTLLIVAALAALAIGVIAVVAGIKALVSAYNADAIAAEKAETAAKNLAEAYNECKQEYEDMISAMENYKTARDGLDDLTKGTEEYREALKEANRQALELINTYGLIEGQDFEWQGDELVIFDEAMDRVKSEKEDEVDKAYAAAQMSGAQAKAARAKSDQTDLQREMRDKAGVGDGDQALTHGVIWGLGAALAPLTGGLSLLAAEMGSMVALTAQQSKSTKFDAAIAKAVEESKTNANLFDSKKAMAEALEIDLNDTELIDALWANKDSITQLSADMNAAAQAEKVAAQNAANEIMSESGYKNTKAGSMALEAGGEVYNQLYKDAYDKYLKDASSRGMFNTGNAESKAAFAEYAKQAGLDQLKGFEVTNYKGDGNIEYKYYDEEGKEQVRTATAEEIAATLAAADAAGKLEGALSQLREKISDLNASKDLGDHAMASFLSQGNLEGATKEEFDDLKNDVTTDGQIDDAKVNAALGLTGNAEADLALAKSYGYESAAAYKEAFIKSLEIEWEIPPGIGEDIAGKMTVGAANKVQKAFETMGQEGGQAFVDTINTIASGADWEALTPDEQTAMLDEIANIDWTSWDAGDRAIEIAEKYGVAIDGTSEAWKRNVNTMRDAANAVPDLDKLRETMAKVKEISDELDLGSILSEEDYKLLVNYNKELENYFTILSDGSAQFTGDLLDYQQSIKEANRQNLEETMRAYQDRILEQQAQYQSGLNMIGGDINNLDQYRDSELYTAENGKQYYSGTNVDTQLKFLESQNYNAEQIASWRQDMEDGFMSVENLDAIGQAVNSVGTEFANLGSEIASDQALVQGLMNEIALGAEDAEERQQLFDEGLINEDALNAAAMAAHNEEKWEGMDPEDVEDYADHLQDAAESSALLSDELKNNEEAAEDVALYTKKMNKGIEALSKGFEEWGDVLTRSDKSSEEFATAMKEIKTAMSDVLGVSEDFLSDDFILQNMEDIKLAAEGDAEAIDRLAIAAAQDILIHVDFEDEAAKAKAMALHGELAGLIPDIQVGATLTGEDEFLQKAQEIVAAAGMTAEQANAYFRAMGFETKFAVEPQPVEQRVPITYTKSSIVEAGIDWDTGAPYWTTATSSWQDGYDTYTGTMDAIAMSTDGKTPKIESLTRTNSGAMNNSSGANAGGNTSSSGGGGNKNKKPEKVDLGERYKEITDSIEDMEDAIDDASKAADRLYGKGRLDQMKAANNLLMEEIGLLKEKKAQAEDYLVEDKQALDKAAKEANVTLDIDDSGRITNYTTTVEILEKRIKDLQDAAMANDGSISESEQEGIDQLQEQADNLLSAIEQYDGTRETLEDVTNEINDQFYAWQDQNYEMLSYSLELKIDIQDEKLETVEYYLDALADDFYAVAEAAALMVGGAGISNSQLDIFRDNLEMQAKHVEDLSGALARNEISHAAYIEGVQNSREAIYDNLTSLRELDKAMMEYYGETLDMASEKIDEHISKMEFQAEKLEHFQNVMAKLGKETDYKSMGTILEGAEAVSKNQVKAAKDVLDFYTGEAETYLAQYQDAIARGDKAAADMAYQYYTDAMERATEAEKEYMASLENWADAARAVLDNKLASFASDFEKSLTGGSSFDQILTSMERAVTLQEEYLTATNQIYETNKLMRTAQQQIDKSTNSVAKSKLQNFIKETEQLQSQGQLSQFELEIQQAKYDLLLAEIALQEAQDAKSVVRLQRDSEGNFGYVYTADQNQVSEAQQQYEDAQNALYNIGLEGANEYAEKSIQAQAEFTQTMSELQQAYLEGAFASEEEYNRAVEEAKAAYYQQLQTYSNLYSVALTTDSRVVADAWSTDFSNMVTNTDQWSQAVDGYIFQVSGAFQEWGNTADQIANASGTNLDNLEHNVQDIVTESENLVESLTGDGGLIEALSGELEKVREVTTAYGEQRQSVLDLIGTYEGLASSLNNAALAQTNYNSAAYENSPTYQAGTVGGSSSGGGGGTSGSGSSGSGGGSGSSGSGSGWDNQGYTVAKVKEAQVYVGTSADGKWGPLSRSAAISKVGSDRIADVFTHMRQNSSGGGNSHLPDLGGGVNSNVFAVAMDTGGYTGEWGPYGKMAMLHEKELVLNKEDTANLLMTMEMLDGIIAQLNLQTQYSQLSNLMSPSYQSTLHEAMEQNVHIEASFPGVSSSNEIEEALNNLINQASQYANRK